MARRTTPATAPSPFDPIRCVLQTDEGPIDLGAYFDDEHAMPKSLNEALGVYRAVRDGRPVPQPTPEVILQRRLRAVTAELEEVGRLEDGVLLLERFMQSLQEKRWRADRANWHAFCAAKDLRDDA